MNLKRSAKCIFLLPRCSIFIQQVSPFSTTAADYSSTELITLKKSQQPKNPRSQETSFHFNKEALTSRNKFSFQESSFDFKKAALTSASTWPRPSQILYQPKLANFVNLIGTIQIPVHFQATPDVKHMAATLIAQKDGNFSDSLLFPIVFQGDLAHAVVCHVKPNDCVYVSGKLSGNQGKFYLIGNEINFVQGLDIQEQAENRKCSVDNNNAMVMEIWEEFISKITSQDEGLKFDGKRVDLDSSIPVGVYTKVKELGLENKVEKKKIEPLKTEKKISSNDGDAIKYWKSVFSYWRDIVKNPMDWRDYREMKSSGLLKARHPDFKHKTNGNALWLNTAPDWVLEGLEGLNVEVLSDKEDSWKNLVENPDKWWDNRSRKTNVKAPDFKHKETGEVLWLNSSPEWVLSQLPCSENEYNAAAVNKKAYVT